MLWTGSPAGGALGSPIEDSAKGFNQMLFRFCALVFFAAIWIPPSAHAQTVARTFVASTGSGSTCSRTAPCGDIQVAIGRTSDGGEVTILDAGDFGTGQIGGKSLTITGTEGAVLTGSQALSAYGSSSTPITITIRNLTFDGRGTAGTYGFRWAAAGLGVSGKLTIENCVFRNFNNSASAGIQIEPTGPSQIVIKDTTITNNGSGTTGGGIVVRYFGGATLLSLERVTANGNVFGIAFDGSNMNATIRDSTFASNSQDGIVATGTSLGVLVSNTASINNNVGIRPIGANVTMRVENSRIVGNATGLSFVNGGALLSAGNNLVQANGFNGSFSGSVPLQ